ncbi:MAG: bifunctional folylpolyglutamate synthase/dihydrofolate synthase [Clostridia bacterium]|nr:bifunctional folylpolyglutamate synthase/dihydrofolate synthase [Clostridia bacterium]
MNYKESLEYIDSVSWKGSRPGLSRITELLALLGNPEREVKCVHVGGTNGKGSFCAMLTSVLIKAGYSVGTFTSPYIETFTERIQLNGENIPEDELAEVATYIRPFADSMDDIPTWFEMITAIGFEYFKRKGVDVVVLEVGMGGRLDATNVIEAPMLSVITGISLDHTEYLGNTIDAIAGEKAGIIKPGCPVLFGGENTAAERVIASAAEEKGCAFYSTDHASLNIKNCSMDGSIFDYKTHDDVRLSLLGLYQPMNASNVIEAVEILRSGGLEISEKALYDGLFCAKWKGRFEKMCQDPLVFFDGGHNIEGAGAAVETVKRYFEGRRINILSGVMADKQYEEMVAIMTPVTRKAFTVAPDNHRSLDAEEYAEVFRSMGISAESFANYDDAVAAAVKASWLERVPLLVLGSLYAYGSFKTALNGYLAANERGGGEAADFPDEK